MKKFILFTFILITTVVTAQSSIAEVWMNNLLFSIRNDYARPTVHARNLYHAAIIMHDAYAVYENEEPFYFLNHYHASNYFPFEGTYASNSNKAAQEEAIYYAMYRMIGDYKILKINLIKY